jgi:hypothetical protein
MPDEGTTQTMDPADAPQNVDFGSLLAEDGNFTENWTDQLPDDLKTELGDSKAFANIKNPHQLLKTAIGSSKLAGRALLPGKDAKPDDWQNVLDAMPKPKEGEGYGLNSEGLTDENLKAFNEKTGYLAKLERVLTRAGVPSAMAARIAEADAAELSDALREVAEDAEAVKAKLVEQYGSEQSYEANRLAGRDALSRLYGELGKEEFDDTVAWLDGMGIADHPRMVALLSRLASRLSPGKITLGGATGRTGQKEPASLASLHGF